MNGIDSVMTWTELTQQDQKTTSQVEAEETAIINSLTVLEFGEARGRWSLRDKYFFLNIYRTIYENEIDSQQPDLNCYHWSEPPTYKGLIHEINDPTPIQSFRFHNKD